jgi:quercetin dioxygenase-like cupin family protein
MAQPHTESSQVIRIAPLGAQLAGASTTAILKARQLEVVRVVLPAGKTLAQHRVPGEITLQCIEGAVQLRTEGAVQELRAGDFVHLQGGAHHELLGLEAASLLLTICLGAGAGSGC